MRKRPARSTRRRRVSSRPKKLTKFLILALSIFIGLFVTVFVFKLLQGGRWKEQPRFTLAIAHANGDVTVAIFETESGTITSIRIPGDTQVHAARQLGSWRLKSIWELGEQEKAGGTFFLDTIVKSFKIPVDAWATEKALGLTDGGKSGLLKALFTPYESNLRFADKFKLASFSLRTKGSEHLTIDMGETGYISKERLRDGEEGYTIANSPNAKIIKLFSIPEVSAEGKRIGIIDATGDYFIAVHMAKIIEVIGAKVSSVEKINPEDLDCEIKGKPSFTTSVIASVFNCSYGKNDTSRNFDVEIILGERFVKRY